MSRVRRINVSQIEGNDANDNSIDEIRPFGEIGVYANEDGPTDKPELLMFDGVRTHLKSKVLGQGILYGSNADSGDGAGLDTIKLIPDAEIYRNGSDQYLVVDPTVPNHIHLRAGGTIDNSNAQLFLGGEITHVSVGAGSTPPVYIKANDNQWTFGTDGSLNFPGSSNSRIRDEGPGLIVRSGNVFAVVTNANSINTYEVEFIGYIHNGFGDAPGATLTVTEIIGGTITDGMTIYGDGLPPEGWTLTFGGVLEPQGSGGTGNYALNGANFLTPFQSFNNSVLALGSRSWTFEDNGELTFPDATVQTTAYVSDKTSGTWTVTPGDNTYSFTVPLNGVYQLWVRGNIPNGIITYTATAAVTNGNVPVLGTQYAWNYIDGGSPILFSSIPAQFVGTEGAISTDTLSVGTTANTFVFGINNTTVENITVNWGYTQIS
jgi:hypothetical protein